MLMQSFRLSLFDYVQVISFIYLNHTFNAANAVGCANNKGQESNANGSHFEQISPYYYRNYITSAGGVFKVGYGERFSDKYYFILVVFYSWGITCPMVNHQIAILEWWL